MHCHIHISNRWFFSKPFLELIVYHYVCLCFHFESFGGFFFGGELYCPDVFVFLACEGTWCCERILFGVKIVKRHIWFSFIHSRSKLRPHDTVPSDASVSVWRTNNFYFLFDDDVGCLLQTSKGLSDLIHVHPMVLAATPAVLIVSVEKHKVKVQALCTKLAVSRWPPQLHSQLMTTIFT